MRSAGIRVLCIAMIVAAGVAVGYAQVTPSPSPDPRVGLKAGYLDAGIAARNIELIRNIPKPEGFFDPKTPFGRPAAPERPPNAQPGEPTPPEAANTQRTTPQTPEQIAQSNALSFTNSDLAFSRDNMIVGNYHGFNFYTIEDPMKARLVSSIVCPGGQGDVSVYGNLLFMSVEQTRGRLDCGLQGIPTPVSAERFRGIRIFDISDLRKPKQIAAIQTCRGSHTHTLVTSPKDRTNLYIYGSGTGAVRSGEELTGCSGESPDKDPNTALFSIDVIQVPLAAPQNAKIVNRPRIFADPATGNISGLWQGGSHGPDTQSSRVTSQCHDITVFSEIGLAAGACTGNGILMDITDPVNPVRLDQVVDKAFAFWHSATFNNDGTKVIFTDEWGGGSRPRCRAIDPPTWGGNAIFDIVGKKLQFRSYYKMPAAQSEQENCVAHNGSLIPIPGRDIMVQAWYQGGLSVFDFSDSSKPVEIAYFDRGPIDSKDLYSGGYWSTYWYNGSIYGSEIARGVDVFKLKASEFLTQNEIDAAALAQVNEFNAQDQRRIVWPANTVVALAYVDQLTRASALTADRAQALRDLLARADKARSGKDKTAAATELRSIVTTLESDAQKASGRDADRMKQLASTIRERANRLR